MADKGLFATQQWLQGLLMAPGALPQRLAAHAEAWGFDETDVVEGGGPATVQRRLSVYAHGYGQRLLECLEADFPALRQFLGEALFAHFGRIFLQEHPSQSFTLFDLGERFAAFLGRTKPADAAPYFYIPESLARVERARAEVLRAPGLEDDTAVEWTPTNLLFETTMVQCAPCCRLLALPFALKDFYGALLKKEEAPMPPERASWLAIGRSAYRLTLDELTESEYRFLTACNRPQKFYALLTQQGMSVADALPLVERFRRKGLIFFSI